MKIKKLRLWMLANDVRVIDIAKDLNVDHHCFSCVSGQREVQACHGVFERKGLP